jgi:hypothetical protein
MPELEVYFDLYSTFSNILIYSLVLENPFRFHSGKSIWGFQRMVEAEGESVPIPRTRETANRFDLSRNRQTVALDLIPFPAASRSGDRLRPAISRSAR